MLPSYTVLPIRVTTPPMIAGSTLVVMFTLRPVNAAELLLDLRDAFGVSGAAVVTSARTTCWCSISRSR
jgi:hypothetical protein